MTDEALKNLVVKALFEVAPDLENEAIDPDESFRNQFEIDSMDLLNFIIKIHEATGVDIPEADYPKFTTLTSCVYYLKQHGQGE